ncbi:uncharacterized protein EV154DRAFT_496269 [Mucor mucedo]|uniref:uncharacterized protein n=1 Tax=Mucor mucedo TaxID=29922 RepID=UPI00221EC06F|nr:uncharacterized protein EV154DRAFT_496269 [Mucor mucedo]KAI7895206.1 hypothetical protein EV154DRAFT_496269 [Mucor mucedo]
MSSRETAPINPLPSSVIIVNESTPLISHDQQLAGGSLHADTSFHLSSVIALSTEPETRDKELGGLSLLIISSLLFTGVSVLVKLLGTTFPSFEIVLARSCTQLPLGLIGCFMLNVCPLGEKDVRKWILFRAVTSVIALSLFFYSLTVLPLIDATAIFFLGPIFKVMISAIVLNENFTIVDGFYSIVCFLGLILVARPSFLFNHVAFIRFDEEEEYQRSFGIACALVASLMSAMAYITVRKVGQGTPVMVHVVYFGCVASLLSIIVLACQLQGFVVPSWSWHEMGLLLMTGVMAFLGQFTLNEGLKIAPIGPVTLIRSTDVIFAFVFGVAFFKEIPGFYTMTGSLLVMGTTTAMSLYRWHRQELRNAAIRRRRSRDRLTRQQQAQTAS